MNDIHSPHDDLVRMERFVVQRESLKKIVDQFEPGDLVLVCGRPSTGKTRFILDVVREMSGDPVTSALYELKMSKQGIADRLRGLGASGNDDAALYCSLNLHVDDSPAQSVRDIVDSVESLKETGPVGVVAVDYLQLMRWEQWEQEDRREGLGQVARELKALAKREKLVVLLAVQMAINVDMRPDRRPRLSDLARLGDVESLSDVVLFLSRPRTGGEGGGETAPVAEVIRAHVAKNKSGPTWESVLYESREPAA